MRMAAGTIIDSDVWGRARVEDCKVIADALFADEWSEYEMTKSVITSPQSPFYFGKYACVVPNASWGAGLHWEADILLCSSSGYLTEIEVKISRSDFLADQKKHKHQWQASINNSAWHAIKKFYYAMPEHIWNRCQDVWRPQGAGVVVVGPWESDGSFRRVDIAIPAETRKAKKLSPEKLLKLHRLVTLRYWSDY